MDRINYWKSAKGDQIVCYCIRVDKQTILKAIKDGCNSLNTIQKVTSACTGNRCKELNPSGKCCSADIKLLIHIYSLEEEDDNDDNDISSGSCSGGCCSGSRNNPKGM